MKEKWYYISEGINHRHEPQYYAEGLLTRREALKLTKISEYGITRILKGFENSKDYETEIENIKAMSYQVEIVRDINEN